MNPPAQNRRSVTRRALLGVLAGSSCAIPVEPQPEEPPIERDGPLISVASFSDAGDPLGVENVPKVFKNATAWRSLLSPRQFAVTRNGATQPAFSGEHSPRDRPGVYRCVCCRTALFDAAAQFDSGTGWPSFFQPIDRRNVVSSWDDSWGVRRRAVACARCDAHLGHVFKDGPPPTYLRYCINAAALDWRPAGLSSASRAG